MHIDNPAIEALKNYYAKTLAGTTNVLDICSSWTSHYPEDWRGERVVGLGMNAVELSRNPHLTEHVVKDLNKNPTLPFPDNSFDVVTNAVSVDYLSQPLEVFKEILRVLKPGGKAIMSFSNRCFPTKVFRGRGRAFDSPVCMLFFLRREGHLLLTVCRFLRHQCKGGRNVAQDKRRGAYLDRRLLFPLRRLQQHPAQ